MAAAEAMAVAADLAAAVVLAARARCSKRFVQIAAKTVKSLLDQAAKNRYFVMIVLEKTAAIPDPGVRDQAKDQNRITKLNLTL